MRRYIPFSTSLTATDNAPDTSNPQPSPREAVKNSNADPLDSPPSPQHPEPSTSPTSHLSSYLPSVPTLPSVRKYLFYGSSSTHSSQELRRRRSSAAGEPPEDTTTTTLTDTAGLPELRGMVDTALGPIENPKESLSKRITSDRLLAALYGTVHERNRLLAQFLRARQHNAHEALAMITNSLHWRHSVDIDHYLADSAKNLIKPSACFPMHIVSTPDTCKQPVVYGLIRLLDKRKAERVAFHNALLSFLESIYFAETYVQDEMVIILDFRDWSIRKNAPYRLVKDGIQTLQDYYPERLGRVFLVNYPTTIRAAYTAVSPIIDAGAKEKIVWIPDADPSATLKKYVAPKSIPTFLGGELEATFPTSWPDVAAEFANAKASHGMFHYH